MAEAFIASGIGHFQSVMERIVLRQVRGRRGYPLNIIAVHKRWR
ncbi:hypothetical protein [Paracidovorax oryzae]|nr:hypothetical protein [Paracidovorax oryzae]